MDTETKAKNPISRRFPEFSLPITSEFEFRAKGEGTEFNGYAALFNVASDGPLGFTETVIPGAFTRSLRASKDHTFVLNHNDDLLLASTRSNRLRLTQDDRGLLVNSDLPHTSYAQDLRALYDDGEVRGMSFSFKPAKGGMRWSDDGATRQLSDVVLGHVTVVTTMNPVYSATASTVQIRALANDLDADPEDLDGLLDSLRAGSPLNETDTALLFRLADHYRPQIASEDEPAVEERSLVDWKALLIEKGVIARA